MSRGPGTLALLWLELPLVLIRIFNVSTCGVAPIITYLNQEELTDKKTSSIVRQSCRRSWLATGQRDGF